MAFEKNYVHEFEIGESEETLLIIAGGITNHDPETDEDSEGIYYYDGNGGSETVYNGFSLAYNFTGHRKYGDEAQEFIRDRAFDLSKRDCYFRVTEPDGRILEGPATIGGVKVSGGDANTRPDFECVISFNGLPTDTKPTPAPEV